MPSTSLTILGSGSKGNAVVVAYGGRLLMLDAGFELPVLVARLEAAGLHPWYVEDVVLSHGHRDHVLGAAHGARVYGWRLWGSLGTVWRWRDLRDVPLQPLEPGRSFDAGAFVVHTAPTPHDVDDSAALVVETRATGARVGYATDLGHAPDAVIASLRGVHALVLESNYDEAMLRAGPYPPEVQDRVAGPTGHLSNAQAVAVARAVGRPDLHLLVLAHVSRHNNTPELARRTMEEGLHGTAFRGRIVVAAQDVVSGPWEVGETGVGSGEKG